MLNLGTSTDIFARESIARGGTGADSITGGDGNDDIYSDVGEDFDIGYASFNPNFPQYYHIPTLDRGSEVDTINAGAGDDFVSIGYGDSAEGGTQDNWSVGDRLFISLVTSPTGITADFRNTTLTIGGGTITGFEAVNYVEGSEFNDVFIFSPDAYPLFPEFGGPSGGGTEISGLGGDDHITGGYYTNNIWGGDGNDLLDGSASQYLMYLSGGEGNDTLIGSWVGAQLDGGNGDDNITSGYGNDWALGGDGNDSIGSGAGVDRVHGGNGNDTLNGGDDGDELYGDAGVDTLVGGLGADRLNGGEGADTLQGGADDDIYEIDVLDTVIENAGEGTDSISIGTSYTLGANFERLSFSGSAAANGTGNELNNHLIGNSSANVLIGLAGNDIISGNGGNDVIEGGEGDDTVSGGAGVDTASYAGAASAVTLNLSLAGAQNTIGAGSDHLFSIENLIGSAFNDTLTGNGANNVLTGIGGNDTLAGGAGGDIFLDTAGNLDGDTIADLALGDKIVITDASLASFSFSLTGSTLTYTGGSLTLTGGVGGPLVAEAAVGGGVQLTLGGRTGHGPNGDFNGDGRSDILWRHDNGR